MNSSHRIKRKKPLPISGKRLLYFGKSQGFTLSETLTKKHYTT